MTGLSRQVREDTAVRAPWPDDLRLDELALRSRRLVIERLNEAALWPRRARAQLLSGDQRARGEHFLERDARGFLGHEDYARLGSEGIFGLRNARLRNRLPVVAGFGHELGNGLHGWLRCPFGTRALAAELCATFNLGVVLFDRICDTLPGGAARLERLFDATTLEHLFADPAHAAGRFALDAARERPEFGILAKTVLRFFQLLRAHAQGPAQRELASALSRAYRAELDTVKPHATLEPSSVLKAVEQKSSLPFAIAFYAVQSCCAPASAGDAQEQAALLDGLGRVFSLVDDAADLCVDLRRGDPNGIVLRAADAAAGRPTELAVLLDTALLVHVASELSAALQAVYALLAAHEVRMDGGWRFEEWLLVTIRGWLDPTRRLL